MKAASKEDSLPVWQLTRARGTHLAVAGTVCRPLLHKLGAATPQSYQHLLPFCDSICSALALLSQRRLNYLFMQIEAVKSKLQQWQQKVQPRQRPIYCCILLWAATSFDVSIGFANLTICQVICIADRAKDKGRERRRRQGEREILKREGQQERGSSTVDNAHCSPTHLVFCAAFRAASLVDIKPKLESNTTRYICAYL